jgi:hypothetical protein
VTENQKVSGTVAVEAVISGNTISQVVFELTGAATLGNTERYSPYVFLGDRNGTPIGWDTTKYPNGAYTLKATATDTTGAASSVSVTFTVANTVSAPSPTAQPAPTQQPGSGGKGPFAKPQLTNPKTIEISNAKSYYRGNGTEDIIVVVKEKMTEPMKISSVRNMVLIGGEFTIDEPLTRSTPMGTASKHRAIGLERIAGVAYIEGIHINNSGGGLTEGIQFWGSSGRLVVRNSRLEGLRTKPGDTNFDFNHCDFLQPINGDMAVENVSMIDSAMQAQFTGKENGAPIKNLWYRNVNTGRVVRQAWFFFKLDPMVVKQCDNCWHDMTGSKYETKFSYALWPQKTLSVMPDGKAAAWYEEPSIKSGITIRRGVPPGGDFAPANKVGRNYDPAFFANK